MHVGIALSPMHLAGPPALPRTPHADHVAELATGTSDAKAPPVDRRIQTRSHPDMGPKVEYKSRPTLLDVGNDYDSQCNEVCVITIDVHPHHSA